MLLLLSSLISATAPILTLIYVEADLRLTLSALTLSQPLRLWSSDLLHSQEEKFNWGPFSLTSDEVVLFSGYTKSKVWHK